MQRCVKEEEGRKSVSFIQRMAQQNPEISYDLSISLTNNNQGGKCIIIEYSHALAWEEGD